MRYEVSELKGYKSLRAFNAFHNLLLTYKMLPLYLDLTFEEFLKELDNKSESERELLLKQMAMLVTLEKEEIEALAHFCKDKNGIPIEAAQFDNFKPNEFIDIIVSVCLEIGKIKIDMVSEEEKKK